MKVCDACGLKTEKVVSVKHILEVNVVKDKEIKNKLNWHLCKTCYSNFKYDWESLFQKYGVDFEQRKEQNNEEKIESDSVPGMTLEDYDRLIGTDWYTTRGYLKRL